MYRAVPPTSGPWNMWRCRKEVCIQPQDQEMPAFFLQWLWGKHEQLHTSRKMYFQMHQKQKGYDQESEEMSPKMHVPLILQVVILLCFCHSSWEEDDQDKEEKHPKHYSPIRLKTPDSWSLLYLCSYYIVSLIHIFSFLVLLYKNLFRCIRFVLNVLIISHDIFLCLTDKNNFICLCLI